ncbi:MAG: GNAT family N-acetyltransferase, partial [Candidatus Staskawiczbacteria bacterium]|nr:GNAT family N-acetyltransferase [Candidatus Staskawiczbacteria bacterium]
ILSGIVEIIMHLSEKKNQRLPSAELLTMAVKKEFRKLGVATGLFQELVKNMKVCGVWEFKLFVGENLGVAINFYENLGCRFDSEFTLHKGYPSRIYLYDIK